MPEKMLPENVGPTEMHELLGVSRRRLGQGVEEGWALRVEKGKYDLAATVAGYVGMLKDNGGGENEDLAKEKLAVLVIKRKMGELDLRTRKGELLEAGELEAFGIGLVSTMKTRLMAVPSSAAPDVHAAETIGEVEQIIRRHVFEALEEIAGAKWSKLAGQG